MVSNPGPAAPLRWVGPSPPRFAGEAAVPPARRVASQFVEGTSVTDGFTPAYLAAHALKLAGAAAGGWYAGRAAGRDTPGLRGKDSG
ncbi:MAG TPA: hypothetical protein VFS49_07705 [Croceibacterium sp.]|nr:hypothetical protein [Croceibacterium sp.]